MVMVQTKRIRTALVILGLAVLPGAGCGPTFVDRNDRIPNPGTCANFEPDGERSCRQCFARGGWLEWRKGSYPDFSGGWVCETVYYNHYDCNYAASPKVRAKCQACMATPNGPRESMHYSASAGCSKDSDHL